ncbi:MAG TPA: hypothetical protein VLG71_00400, partial [Candidatus Limnocylindria bacterium]|nr:hypothetical protein [Candidatus Limnocylindria bacterium]
WADGRQRTTPHPATTATHTLNQAQQPAQPAQPTPTAAPVLASSPQVPVMVNTERQTAVDLTQTLLDEIRKMSSAVSASARHQHTQIMTANANISHCLVLISDLHRRVSALTAIMCNSGMQQPNPR